MPLDDLDLLDADEIGAEAVGADPPTRQRSTWWQYVLAIAAFCALTYVLVRDLPVEVVADRGPGPHPWGT